MAATIEVTEKGTCYICGRSGATEVHHVFYGSANRKISEELGAKVNLCSECHHKLIHEGTSQEAELWRQKLHERFQEKLEGIWQGSDGLAPYQARERFRQYFGRSWL